VAGISFAFYLIARVLGPTLLVRRRPMPSAIEA
jgi:hypothetical protein